MNLQEQINRGYHHIHVNSHGESLYWYLEFGRFMTTNVNQLSNNSPTIITTTACFTNAFDNAEPCLSEVLLRSPNSGVVAYLGATRENTNANIGLGPASEICGLFYKHLATTSNNIGLALKKTQESLICNNNITKENLRWAIYTTNLMGDPEMPVYMDIPRELTGFTWNINEGVINLENSNFGYSATITSKNDNGASFLLTKTTSSSTDLEIPVDKENYQLCIRTNNSHIPVVITDLNSSYVQNKTFTGINHITGSNIRIGRDVDPISTKGPVIIESGSTTFDASNSVTIKNDFECKKGATLEIK